MDFGYVVYGIVCFYVVWVINNGYFLVLFVFERVVLLGSGFGVELDWVCNFFGELDNESVEFMVIFDLRVVGFFMGFVDVYVFFYVLSGLLFGLRIKVVVIMLDMGVFIDLLDFGVVECGNSKVMII